MLLLALARDSSGFLDFFSFLEQIELLQAIILIVGLLLLVVEIFVPGFGVAGGTGVVLLILGIFLTASSPFEAMAMFVLLLVLIAIVLTIVLRSAKSGRLSRTLILQSSSKKEYGYSSSNDPSALIGKTGRAMTHLRPAGTGEFDGKRIDIVSDGGFIDKGETVRIINAYGSRIVVEAVLQPEEVPDRSGSEKDDRVFDDPGVNGTEHK